MEEIMKKRQKEVERVYEEQWDGGKGSHHPDYDPEAVSCVEGPARAGSKGRGQRGDRVSTAADRCE